jgi:hypothetical protein
LLKKVTYPPVLKWWLNTYNRATTAGKNIFATSTRTRVQDYVNDGNLYDILLGEQSVDFSTWINQNKIVLIKLPTGEPTDDVLALTNDSRQLLGALILQQVKAAAWTQVHAIPDERDRPLVPFYVDEFPEFATPDFGDMFRKLRKSGIIPVIAHQDLAQLPNNLDAIPKSARHFFCFVTTIDDAPLAAAAFTPEGKRLDVPLSVHPLRDAPQRLRDGAVLQLVHDLDSLTDSAVVRAEIAVENKGGKLRTSRWSALRTELENASNRFLFEVMQGGTSQDASFRRVKSCARDMFQYANDKLYLQTLLDLADILAVTPVYATGKDDTESAGQASAALERRLIKFKALEAYCKTDDTEQYVKMEPLPRVDSTHPDVLRKHERIREHILALGIIKPRGSGGNLHSRDGFPDGDIEDDSGDEPGRWEEA